MLGSHLNCRKCKNQTKNSKIIVKKSAEIYQIIDIPGNQYRLEKWHHQYAIEKREKSKRVRYEEIGWGETVFRKIGSGDPTKEEITLINSYIWELIIKGKLLRTWNSTKEIENMRARAKTSTLNTIKNFLAD